MPASSKPIPSPAPTTIALAAGGTGGHVFPAVALARELLARGHRVIIQTDSRGATYVDALAGLEHVVLPASHLQGGLLKKARAALTIARALWLARVDLKRRGAALLVGFGGYPSVAPALAARSLGLPLLLHEQASQLSRANRHLLRQARALAVSFPDTRGTDRFDPARIHLTGNPVRQAIVAARAPYPVLDGDTPLYLLVIGGSQSAQVFGRVVPPALLALPEPLRQRLHVDLQYRGGETEAITQRLHGSGISATVSPFFADVGERMARAHLIITRAGASTAADVLTIGRPAIFVPLPHGGSREEQRRNAETLAAAGVGWMLPESELSAGTLSARLAALFATPSVLAAAAGAATALGQPHAAAWLADVVERYCP